MAQPLAELHLHLYGTIRAEHYLDHLGSREVDWAEYERAYEEAYGAHPPLREILDRHRAGDLDAAGEFKDLFVFGDDDAGCFDRFQAKFNLLIAGSQFAQLRSRADPIPPLLREIHFFVERMLEDQRRQGIQYAEQRLLLGTALSHESAALVLESILDAYDAASRGGFTARLAASLPRDDPWPMWDVVRELAQGPRGEGLTGIDFCNVEEGHPPKDKAEFLASVQGFNQEHPERALSVLYHVGESFSDKSLESAIRWVQEAAELGANRLGHAIALGVDPDCYGEHERTESVAERRDQIDYDLKHAEALRPRGVRVDEAALRGERDALRARDANEVVAVPYDRERLDQVRLRQDFAMERVRATGAVVEVCPASNRRIGDIGDPDHHPVHRFLEHGVRVVVSTDDPGIFDVTLDQEIDWVVAAAGLTPAERDDLIADSWRARSEVLSGRS
jgi:adenosine deaminase